ncbi:hypothetical protein N7517_010678 [Penicillium concentricum]|uniref:Uncharacterized protein n=1 Tax=Penicillium concentricum TaxID=293559 RepID=A0A9W9RB83_9EURO|nr:uncharacterized protein N7517_010678 [Penicillium concentricum]KAJ5356069.1 hypothetical protein N7517_010678 [Penicillium concentricum]
MIEYDDEEVVPRDTYNHHDVALKRASPFQQQHQRPTRCKMARNLENWQRQAIVNMDADPQAKQPFEDSPFAMALFWQGSPTTIQAQNTELVDTQSTPTRNGLP